MKIRDMAYRARIAGLLLTVLYALFLLIPITRFFTNFDEAGNITAGLSIWKFGTFELYNVNPPLPRTMATAPIAFFCRPEVDWEYLEKERQRAKIDSRPEFSMGLSFVRANLEHIHSYLVLSRLMCIPFALLGAYFCWRWAKELYGDWAGLCALALWCFCPNILTWSSMVMPDIPAASFGVMAAYFFWKYLCDCDYHNAFVSGLTLGLALLTKLTWIFLLLLFPVLLFFWYFAKEENRIWLSFRQRICQVLAIIAVALFVLNLGYGFEGTLTKLGDYRFASRTLAGKYSVVDGNQGGNRFERTSFAYLPVPLPRNYVLGADIQKVDFEKGLSSYLFGQWQNDGWWYYYFVCVVLKIPLGIWCLGIITLVFSFRKYHLCCWQDQIILLAPAIILFIFVSSQTGFSRHFRYVLPAFPFLYIWISQIAEIAAKRSWKLKVVILVFLSWFIISSLSVFPYSMSYFNEIAGGPKNGHKYLLDSNIDWGQDVFALKKWIEKHPEAKNLHLLMRDDIAEALFLDKDYPKVPFTPDEPIQKIFEEDNEPCQIAPQPGWFAASVHQIHEKHGRYKYLLDIKPVDSVGYSIYIYHIPLDEANHLRSRCGLPLIQEPRQD